MKGEKEPIRPAVRGRYPTVAEVVKSSSLPYRDGTTHVIFEPEDFIARLAALVPKPRAHLTRYHGVFAPASPDRARVVPETRAVAAGETVESSEPSATDRQRSLSLKRNDSGVSLPVFGVASLARIDIEVCRRCGGKLQVIASIEDPPVIEWILEHLGGHTESVDPARPGRAPPRGDLLV